LISGYSSPGGKPRSPSIGLALAQRVDRRQQPLSLGQAGGIVDTNSQLGHLDE